VNSSFGDKKKEKKRGDKNLTAPFGWGGLGGKGGLWQKKKSRGKKGLRDTSLKKKKVLRLLGEPRKNFISWK